MVSNATLLSLIRALADEVPEARRIASDELKRLGADAYSGVRTFIKELVENENSETQWAAVEALREIGPEAEDIPLLTQLLLEGKSYAARWRAVEAIREVNQGVEVASASIIKALGDENYWVRRHSLEALRVSKDQAVILQKLSTALIDDESPNVRSQAAIELGAVGKRAAYAVPALIKAISNDQDSVVRSCAAEALGKVGSKSSNAMSALVGALTDEDVNVQRKAAESLSVIGPGSVLVEQALKDSLRHADRDVRVSAAIALGGNDSVTSQVAKILVDALEAEPTNIRAWNALVNIFKESQNIHNGLELKLSPETISRMLPEAIAQGVLPTIGVKTWHKLQIEFPSREYPWNDKGVFHSWESHEIKEEDKPPHKINLVCIHSDWFCGIHLIAAAALITSPPEYLDLITKPPRIEGEEVGFLIQSGGNLRKLDGMRTLPTPFKTDRIDYVFGNDLRLLQYLTFAGLSAQMPLEARTAQEVKGAQVWEAFTKEMRYVFAICGLEEFVNQEWFSEVGRPSSRYRMRYERLYREYQHVFTKLIGVIQSTEGEKFRAKISIMLMALLNELENVLWKEGLKRYPVAILQRFLDNSKVIHRTSRLTTPA